MAKDKGQSKTPTESTKIPFGAQVFSMPERYRHGAEAALKEPAVPKKPVPQVVAPVPPKAPPAPPVKPTAKKPKKSGTKMLIFVGVLLLAVLGVGGYLLVQSVQPETEIVIEEPKDDPKDEVVIDEPKDEPDDEPDDEPKDEPDTDPFATEIVRGIDSDSDGLTDTEEEFVYNTDPRLPDTDSDGFLDGNEVFHRYNPNGESAGGNTLLESGVVVSYEGEAHTILYAFMYPTNWDVEEDDELVVIDSGRGEGFRVGYERKTIGLSIEDWVDINVGIEDPVEDVTKNGLEMILSENTLFAYVDLGEAVLTLEYDTGTKARVDFLQTFKMLLNSIEITGTQEVIDAASDEDADTEEEEEPLVEEEDVTEEEAADLEEETPTDEAVEADEEVVATDEEEEL